MKKHVLVSTCFVILTALGGCGGGGSAPEQASEAKASTAVAEVRISGVAGPGAVRKGEVAIYELDASGERIPEPLAKSQTSAGGAYELVLGAEHAGSAVEVEVSARETGTTMICGAARCGSAQRFDELPLPKDFALSALVVVPPGGGPVQAPVTPWSAMVAERVKALQRASPGLQLAEAYLQASAEVGQVVGLDVAGVNPALPNTVQIAGDLPAQYAVVSAAVIDMLLQRNDTSSIPQSLQNFTLAMTDGAFGNAGDGFTAVDFSAALRRTLDHAPELSSNTVEALTNLSARFDLIGNEGFEPGYDRYLALPANASRAEKIAAFQVFTSQVRTWLSSLGELEAEELTQAFAIDTGTVRLLADGEVQSQFQFVGDLVDQILAFTVDNPQLVQVGLLTGELCSLNITNDEGRVVGEVSLHFADDEGLQIQASGVMTGAANNVYRPLDIMLATGFPVDELLAVTRNLQTDPTAFAAVLAAHKITVTGYLADGQGNHTLTLHRLSMSHQLNPAMAFEEGGAIDPADIFKSASLVGNVTVRRKGAVFSGNLEQWVVRLGAYSRRRPLFSERWRLSGEFVSPDKAKRFTASVTVRATSGTAFDTFSWLEYGNEKRYISGSLRDVNALFSLAGPLQENTLLPAVSLSASFSAGDTPSGTIEAVGYSANAQAYQAYLTCLNAQSQALEENLFLASPLTQNDICAASNLQPVRFEMPLTYMLLNRLKSDIRQDVMARYGLSAASVRSLIINEVHGHADLAGHVNSYTASIGFESQAVTEDFQDVSFTVAGHAKLPDMRTAQVAVSGQAAGEDGAHLRTDVAWNKGSYTAVFDIDSVADPNTLSARLLNAQGYELSMNVSRMADGSLQLSGNASIDDDVVGHLELRDGNLPLIVYPNGDSQIVETIY